MLLPLWALAAQLVTAPSSPAVAQEPSRPAAFRAVESSNLAASPDLSHFPLPATAHCLYDPSRGGIITAILPGSLGAGYTSPPAVHVDNASANGSGLAVTANLSAGRIAGYTVTNPGSGYTQCPRLAVAPPLSAFRPASDGQSASRRDASARRSEAASANGISTDIRVDDFGCAGDGIADDTLCINRAIAYATQYGTKSGAVSFSAGKTYFVNTITGYLQTAWDDGSAPASDTCGHQPCPAISPEVPGQFGFAIKLYGGRSQPLTLFGNGATIRSGYTAAAAKAGQFSLNAPYFAVFGSDGKIDGLHIRDLTIDSAFAGFASFAGAYWSWDNITMNGIGIALLCANLQYTSFRNIFLENVQAGFILGGWWGNRAPATSHSGYLYLNSANLADSLDMDGFLFYGSNWPTARESATAQHALDTWFDTWFYHSADFANRLTDQNRQKPEMSVWRGIYHVALATYSPFGRPVDGVNLRNLTIKSTQNYPIIASDPWDWTIDTLGTEDVGWCDGNPKFGTYGSAACPDPYDSTHRQLPGAILMVGFRNLYFRNIALSPNPIAETAVEPPGVSAENQLRDFRANLTNLQSKSGAPGVVAARPVPTGRLVIGPSSRTATVGERDFNSGELCLDSTSNGYPDLWCLRGDEETLADQGWETPRYLVLENQGYFAMRGQPVVQMPGLRVRPGALSALDATLPLTDLHAEQFSLAAGGKVAAGACVAIEDIDLQSTGSHAMVMTVRPPTPAGSLLLNGTVTAARTMTLHICNPLGSAAQTYPAGIYDAILAGLPDTPTTGTALPTK